jgi:hypothetical protein
MSKLVQVTAPVDRQEIIWRMLCMHSNVHSLSAYEGKKSTLIIFKCLGRHLQDVLNRLHDIGVCIERQPETLVQRGED